ncbi:hypothetical protein ACETU7_22505 [Rhodococcus sp. 3Y1]
MTGTNTGKTTLNPVVLTDDLSKVLDNATLVDGSLKATVDVLLPLLRRSRGRRSRGLVFWSRVSLLF